MQQQQNVTDNKTLHKGDKSSPWEHHTRIQKLEIKT